MHPANTSLVLYVPHMHPQLLPQSLPGEVCRFDPGLAGGLAAATEKQDVKPFLPDGLPLQPAQAAAWLREIVQYGMQFDSPGQLAATTAASSAALGQSIGGMRSDELEDISSFKARGGEQEQKPEKDLQAQERAKAQCTLLLAWNLEERNLELSDLSKGLASHYERFGKALGLEDDGGEAEDELNSPVPLDDQASSLPRLQVVGAMLAFLPPESCLYTEDDRLYQEWRERGVEFSPAQPESLPFRCDVREAGSLVTASAPGWKLAGLSRPTQHAPWLDREYSAVCFLMHESEKL